jgi:hypothetical protein
VPRRSETIASHAPGPATGECRARTETHAATRAHRQTCRSTHHQTAPGAPRALHAAARALAPVFAAAAADLAAPPLRHARHRSPPQHLPVRPTAPLPAPPSKPRQRALCRFSRHQILCRFSRHQIATPQHCRRSRPPLRSCCRSVGLDAAICASFFIQIIRRNQRARLAIHRDKPTTQRSLFQPISYHFFCFFLFFFFLIFFFFFFFFCFRSSVCFRRLFLRVLSTKCKLLRCAVYNESTTKHREIRTRARATSQR